jgi:hypothetical protein
MVNGKRRFNVAEVPTLGILAEKLTQHTWTLCTGFKLVYFHEGKHRTFYFLNDSFSEDGAGEFAVYEDGVQVESWTCSWMEIEGVINEHFPALLRNKHSYKGEMPVVQTAEEHDSCFHCM